MSESKTKNTRKTRTNTNKATKEVEKDIKPTETTEATANKESFEKENTTTTKTSRKSLTSIDLYDLVPVIALVDSVIFVADNTKAEYVWDSKGDVQYVTYGELISMKGKQKRFFEEMWIYVDDEEVVEALNLTSLYKKFDEIKSLESYLDQFDSNHDLIQSLKPLPEGIKKSLGRQAAKLIQEDKLDGHNTIRALENCLGVELAHLLDDK